MREGFGRGGQQANKSRSIVFADGTAAVVIDQRHLPSLMFVSWHGQATEKVVRGYFGWMNQFHRDLGDRQRYVMVVDLMDNQPVSASARKMIAQVYAENFGEEDQRFSLGMILVVQNPLLRGAMTAVGWLIKHDLKLHFAGSNKEAIADALTLFQQGGVSSPIGLSPDTFERPGFHPSKA